MMLVGSEETELRLREGQPCSTVDARPMHRRDQSVDGASYELANDEPCQPRPPSQPVAECEKRHDNKPFAKQVSEPMTGEQEQTRYGKPRDSPQVHDNLACADDYADPNRGKLKTKGEHGGNGGPDGSEVLDILGRAKHIVGRDLRVQNAASRRRRALAPHVS